MPITQITQQSTGPQVAVTCVNCTADQKVDAAALILGTVAFAHVIAIPPCACGAQEFLQRTTDVHPVESQAGHRKSVNALAEHLKAKGLIHPKHVDEVAAMTTPAQIGPLVGDVPESSLPPVIVHKRRRAREAAAVAASAPAPDAVAAAKAVLEAAKAAYAKAVGAAS